MNGRNRVKWAGLAATIVGVLVLSAGCKSASIRRSGGTATEATSALAPNADTGVVPASAQTEAGAAGAVFPAQVKAAGACKT